MLLKYLRVCFHVILVGSICTRMPIVAASPQDNLSPMFHPSMRNKGGPISLYPLHLDLPSLSTENGSHKRNGRQRKVQTSDTSCLNDAPFLWLIQKDNVTEGLGVGTMHLRRQLVVSTSEWASLLAALDDACTVYGEFDVTDLALIDELLMDSDCADLPSGYQVTRLRDLPDPDLKAQLEAALLEVATEYADSSSQVNAYYKAMTTQIDLEGILTIVQHWNSNIPGIKDPFFDSLFNPSAQPDLDFMDVDLLRLGKPSKGLETIDETCAYVREALMPTRSEFVSNYETKYKVTTRALAEESVDPLVEAYRCGSTEGIVDVVEVSLPTLWEPEKDFKALFDTRNKAMAARMVQAMEADGDLPVFAVGLAHWIFGEESFEILLAKSNYTLVRIEGPYDGSLIPDAQCSDSGVDVLPPRSEGCKVGMGLVISAMVSLLVGLAVSHNR